MFDPVDRDEIETVDEGLERDCDGRTDVDFGRRRHRRIAAFRADFASFGSAINLLRRKHAVKPSGFLTSSERGHLVLYHVRDQVA
jgi:hypothetical protein